jgi:hypothetical protein
LVASAGWPLPARAALGARQQAPGCFAVPAEATIRRTLARLDADALAGAIGAWLADQQPLDPGPAVGVGRRRAVAVDGKTLRGARTAAGDGRPVHLLAAMDHQRRAVLAQRQVGGGGGCLDPAECSDRSAGVVHDRIACLQLGHSGPMA